MVREGLIRGNLGQVAMKFVNKDLWSNDYMESTNFIQ